MDEDRQDDQGRDQDALRLAGPQDEEDDADDDQHDDVVRDTVANAPRAITPRAATRCAGRSAAPEDRKREEHHQGGAERDRVLGGRERPEGGAPHLLLRQGHLLQERTLPPSSLKRFHPVLDSIRAKNPTTAPPFTMAPAERSTTARADDAHDQVEAGEGSSRGT